MPSVVADHRSAARPGARARPTPPARRARGPLRRHCPQGARGRAKSIRRAGPLRRVYARRSGRPSRRRTARACSRAARPQARPPSPAGAGAPAVPGALPDRPCVLPLLLSRPRRRPLCSSAHQALLAVVLPALLSLLDARPVAAAPTAVPTSGPTAGAFSGAWDWPLQERPPLGRTFRPGVTRYAPGHRGVDLVGEAGAAVLAAGAGRWRTQGRWPAAGSSWSCSQRLQKNTPHAAGATRLCACTCAAPPAPAGSSPGTCRGPRSGCPPPLAR